MKQIIYQEKLSDQVKDYIRRQIERGILRPGDRIREKELSQTLGLSRTPIREALIQLSSEGIVEVLPRRLIRIKKNSLKDLKDLYTIISTLEAQAAEVAVELCTEEDIAEQERLYEKMKKAIEKDNFPEYKKLNDRAHDLLVAKMNNSVLNELMPSLKKRFFDFPLILSGIPEWLDLMMSDHFTMIQCLKKRDKAGIRKIIKEHFNYERNVTLRDHPQKTS
jgi:DNA-binding GntR family transcriptional regulator